MKKILSALIICVMVFALAACGGGPAPAPAAPAPAPTPAPAPAPATSGSAPAPAPAPAPATPAPAAGGAAPAASGGLNDKPTIKIGAFTYMTGANKMLGEYITPAFELAEAEINAAGGLLGKKVEFVYVDQGEDQQGAINATMKLLNDDDICAIVGPNASVNTVAVIGTLRDHEILYMANGSSYNIAKEKVPTVYQIRITDDLMGALMAKAMVERFNVKSPAILYGNDTFGEGLGNSVKDALKNTYSINTASFINFDPTNERNFSPHFTQILNSKADSLMVIAGQIQGPLIMQQAQKVEFAGPKFCASSLMSADVIEMAGGAANGWFSIADWSTEIQTKEGKHLVDSYKAKAGRLPNVYAVYAYDASQVVFEAIRKAGSVNRADILAGIKEIKGLPVSMSTMTYRESHSLADSILFVECKDSIPVVLDVIRRPE